MPITKPKTAYSLEDHRPYALALEKRSELTHKVIAAEEDLARAKDAYSQATLASDGATFLSNGEIPDGPPADQVRKAQYRLEIILKARDLHAREVEAALEAARQIVGPKLRAQHEKAVAEVVRCLKALEQAFETERALRNAAPGVMAGPTGVINFALNHLDIGTQSDPNGPYYQVLKSLRASGYRI